MNAAAEGCRLPSVQSFLNGRGRRMRSLPYCANIAASWLWQCVLLLLHSSRRARCTFLTPLIKSDDERQARTGDGTGDAAAVEAEKEAAVAVAVAAELLAEALALTYFSNFKAERRSPNDRRNDCQSNRENVEWDLRQK